MVRYEIHYILVAHNLYSLDGNMSPLPFFQLFLIMLKFGPDILEERHVHNLFWAHVYIPSPILFTCKYPMARFHGNIGKRPTIVAPSPSIHRVVFAARDTHFLAQGLQYRDCCISFCGSIEIQCKITPVQEGICYAMS